MRLLPAGDFGILVELEDLAQVLALNAALAADPPPGLVSALPAARTILLEVDPQETSARDLAARLRAMPVERLERREGRIVEIPVRYDGEDLEEVARLTGLSPSEVAERHMGRLWEAAFNGFAPGFSYLVGGDPALEVSRRESPRLAVPAGAVALAGRFSAVYPKASPGGWRLIGTTDLPMWDETRDPPALLQPGDRARFVRASGAPAAPRRPKPAPPPEGLGLRVLAAGFPALWQDSGRHGLIAQGVSPSGALDQGAFRSLNRLLGNAPGTPALEILGGGFAFEAEAPGVFALTGAPVRIRLNGRRDLPSHAPLALEAGDRIEIAPPERGLRSLLGVRGGFRVAPVLGSASTDVLAGLGPEPVTTGARLIFAGARAGAVGPPEPPPLPPRPGDLVEIGVILGPRADWFPAEVLESFLAQDWRVTPQIGRVGLRLEGAPLLRSDARELPSEGCPAGAIQIPHAGQPVLFLADHPLTGGYPVIAVVAARHLDLLAQSPPGARLRFRPLAAPDWGRP